MVRITHCYYTSEFRLTRKHSTFIELVVFEWNRKLPKNNLKFHKKKNRNLFDRYSKRDGNSFHIVVFFVFICIFTIKLLNKSTLNVSRSNFLGRTTYDAVSNIVLFLRWLQLVVIRGKILRKTKTRKII